MDGVLTLLTAESAAYEVAGRIDEEFDLSFLRLQREASPPARLSGRLARLSCAQHENENVLQCLEKAQRWSGRLVPTCHRKQQILVIRNRRNRRYVADFLARQCELHSVRVAAEW